MPNLERIGEREIQIDIKNRFRFAEPKREGPAAWITIALILVFMAMAIVGCVIDSLVWCSFLAIPGFFMVLLVPVLWSRWRMKKVRLQDYEITTDFVSEAADESFFVKRAPLSSGCHVQYRVLRFKTNGKWWIPEQNYLWSERNSMSDGDLLAHSHRGDEFIIVIEKKTRRVVVAYHTKFFEYKGERLTVLEENRNA